MVRFEGGHPVNDPENEPIEDGWYYTVKEVAKMLNVPESSVRVMKKRGQIRCKSYYGRTYIDPKSVTARFK